MHHGDVVIHKLVVLLMYGYPLTDLSAERFFFCRFHRADGLGLGRSGRLGQQQH